MCNLWWVWMLAGIGALSVFITLCGIVLVLIVGRENPADAYKEQ